MIKKILGIALIAIIAITAGWNFSQSTNEEVALTDLALANVEALARYEIEIGVPCVYDSEICYQIADDLGWDIIWGYK